MVRLFVTGWPRKVGGEALYRFEWNLTSYAVTKAAERERHNYNDVGQLDAEFCKRPGTISLDHRIRVDYAHNKMRIDIAILQCLRLRPPRAPELARRVSTPQTRPSATMCWRPPKPWTLTYRRCVTPICANLSVGS